MWRFAAVLEERREAVVDVHADADDQLSPSVGGHFDEDAAGFFTGKVDVIRPFQADGRLRNRFLNRLADGRTRSQCDLRPALDGQADMMRVEHQ